MEVHATIFMICAYHVLSGFTQTFSSRQREKRRVPQEKIRRIPIVYSQNHNKDVKDGENQSETAVRYIMPHLEAFQERIPQSNSNWYIYSNKAGKMLKADVPNMTSRRESRSYSSGNTYIKGWDREGVGSRLTRHNKPWFLLRQRTPGITTSTVSPIEFNIFDYSPKKDQKNSLKWSEENRQQNSSFECTPAGLTQTFLSTKCRKDMRPWEKFCYNNDCKATEATVCTEKPPVTTCPTPTKIQSCATQSSATQSATVHPFFKTTSDSGRPWLFYTDRPKFEALAKALHRKTVIAPIYPESIPLNNVNKKYRSIEEKDTPEMGPSGIERLLTRKSTLANIFTPSGILESSRNRRMRRYILFPMNEVGAINGGGNTRKETAKILNDISDANRPMDVESIQNKLVQKKKFDILFGSKLFQNKLHSMINNGESGINRRALEGRNVKRSAYMVFFPMIRNDKRCNASMGLPQCRKSCFYNLTELINSRTIKPPDYYKKKGPSLVLCCPSKEDIISFTTSKNGLDDLAGAHKSSTPKVLRNATATDSLNKNLPTYTGITGKAITTAGIHTAKGADMLTTTISPSLYKINMQFRDVSTKKTSHSTSTTPKEQMIIKLLAKNNEGLIDTFDMESKPELERFQWPLKNFFLFKDCEKKGKSMKGYIMKIRRRKKTKPWDKYCPCEGSSTCCTGATGDNKQPWISTCCGIAPDNSTHFSEVSNTMEDAKTMEYGGMEITPSTVVPSMYKVDKEILLQAIRDNESRYVTDESVTCTPDIKYVNAKKQELLDLLQGRANNKDNVVVLVRLPVDFVQKLGKNGSINLVLPTSNTLMQKYIRPRSIFNHFLSSMFRKTTTPKVYVINPWEEPWKFKEQEKFNLFTTHLPSHFAKNIENRKELNPRKLELISCYESTSETGPLGFDQYEKKSEICPSCGNRRNCVFVKTYLSTKLPKCISEENDQWYDSDLTNGCKRGKDFRKEDCDDRCISCLLKFPKEDLVENSSPISIYTSKRLHSPTKAFKLIINDYTHPKYFVEVPDALGKIVENVVEPTYSSKINFNKEKSSVKPTLPEKLLLRPMSRKNPIVLYLQPFEVDGRKVYLPVSDRHSSSKSKDVSTIDQNHYSDDTPDYNCQDRCTSVADADFVKNDSLLPFALIPAYLTFHPKSKFSYDLNIEPKTSYKDDTLDGSDISLPNGSKENFSPKSKNKDHVQVDKVPIENKWIRIAQQIESALQHSLSSGKISSKQHSISSKKPTSNSPLEKPTFVILVKELDEISPLMEAGAPFVENSKFIPSKTEDFTIFEYKDGATIGPLDEAYVNN